MLSVVIPAFNEEGAVGPTIAGVRAALAGASVEHEIIVVNDGSADRTAELAKAEGATVISHPVNLGYGRSLRTGIAAAKGDVIAITDADGSYPTDQIPKLAALVQAGGFDMVIGARHGRHLGRLLTRPIFRWLCQWATGTRIPDINSGMRVFKKEIAVRFWDSLGPGYSFTTTITLLALLNMYVVCYVPIEYRARVGSSKVRFLRDSLRAAQILVEAILAHNPIKIFLPLAAATFALGLAALITGAFVPLRGTLYVTAAAMLAAAPILLGLGFAAVAIQRATRGSRSNGPPSPGPRD